MKAWTLNPPTQSPGDLQHSWEQTKDVGVADALTDNVQQKDKDEEDKEDVDTEEASSLDQSTADRRKDVDTEGVLTEPGTGKHDHLELEPNTIPALRESAPPTRY